jgi:hypothetical protein
VPGLFNGHRRSLKGLRTLTGFDLTGVPNGPLPSPTTGADAAAVDQFVAAAGVKLLRRRMSDWTSYYALAPSRSAQVIRNLARQADVHLFCETDDVLYANVSLVVLHARDSGERVLRFPGKADIVDVVHGARWAAADEVRLEAQPGETLLLSWKTCS